MFGISEIRPVRIHLSHTKSSSWRLHVFLLSYPSCIFQWIVLLTVLPTVVLPTVVLPTVSGYLCLLFQCCSIYYFMVVLFTVSVLFYLLFQGCFVYSYRIVAARLCFHTCLSVCSHLRGEVPPGPGPTSGRRGGVPPTEQHGVYLLRGGRYASCVHAGGLSCFIYCFRGATMRSLIGWRGIFGTSSVSQSVSSFLR